jgi:hypothetical protein
MLHAVIASKRQRDHNHAVSMLHDAAWIWTWKGGDFIGFQNLYYM